MINEIGVGKRDNLNIIIIIIKSIKQCILCMVLNYYLSIGVLCTVLNLGALYRKHMLLSRKCRSLEFIVDNVTHVQIRFKLFFFALWRHITIIYYKLIN